MLSACKRSRYCCRGHTCDNPNGRCNWNEEIGECKEARWLPKSLGETDGWDGVHWTAFEIFRLLVLGNKTSISSTRRTRRLLGRVSDFAGADGEGVNGCDISPLAGYKSEDMRFSSFPRTQG